MTSDQVRAALDQLGLKQVELARLFRVTERTARNWVRQGVSGPPEILLRLMLVNPRMRRLVTSELQSALHLPEQRVG